MLRKFFFSGRNPVYRCFCWPLAARIGSRHLNGSIASSANQSEDRRVRKCFMLLISALCLVAFVTVVGLSVYADKLKVESEENLRLEAEKTREEVQQLRYSYSIIIVLSFFEIKRPNKYISLQNN